MIRYVGSEVLEKILDKFLQADDHSRQELQSKVSDTLKMMGVINKNQMGSHRLSPIIRKRLAAGSWIKLFRGYYGHEINHPNKVVRHTSEYVKTIVYKALRDEDRTRRQIYIFGLSNNYYNILDLIKVKSKHPAIYHQIGNQLELAVKRKTVLIVGKRNGGYIYHFNYAAFVNQKVT